MARNLPSFPPLDADRQRLAAEALRRSKRIAARYARIYREHAADIFSAAAYGAVMAAGTLSATKSGANDPWKHWSTLRIRGSIHDYLKCKGSVFLVRASSRQADLAERPDVAHRDTMAAHDAEDAFERLIRPLNAKHARAIMRLVYRDGYLPFATGPVLGITGTQACRIHTESLAKLRQWHAQPESA